MTPMEKHLRLQAHREEHKRLCTLANYLAVSWLNENCGRQKDLDVALVRNMILDVLALATDSDEFTRLATEHPNYRHRAKAILEMVRGDLPELAGRLIRQYQFERAEAA